MPPGGGGGGSHRRASSGAAPGSKQDRPQDSLKDEQHAENLKEMYRFLAHRLRADIRFLFHSLPEFVDLPQDVAQQKSWQDVLADMEAQVASLAPANAGDGDSMSLEAVAALLNHRDRAIGYLCEGLLFQKALLIREQHLGGPAADGDAEGPLAEFAEQIRRRADQDANLPEKHQLQELPLATDPGNFTFDKTKASRAGVGAGVGGQIGNTGESEVPSQLQCRVLVTLREMQSLDRAIRHVKFGEKVSIPDKHRPAGRTIGSDEVRKEITRWFDRCSKLEHELQTRKAQRHTPWEVQVEFYKNRCQEKDQQNLAYKSRVFKLEQDVINFKQEFTNIRREKAELAEKNQKMVSENLPVLDRIDAQLDKSREKVNQLTADAEMLHSMFKLQVEENVQAVGERDTIDKELAKARRQLKDERDDNKYKEAELEKKEKLHRLTVEAREAARRDYLETKNKVKEVEKKMLEQEAQWRAKLREVEGRDSDIRLLQEELRQAHQEIDGLEQRKKHCMQEFKAITGGSYSMLLEQFKVVPPADPPKAGARAR